jgi:hypothetical protein
VKSRRSRLQLTVVWRSHRSEQRDDADRRRRDSSPRGRGLLPVATRPQLAESNCGPRPVGRDGQPTARPQSSRAWADAAEGRGSAHHRDGHHSRGGGEGEQGGDHRAPGGRGRGDHGLLHARAERPAADADGRARAPAGRRAASTTDDDHDERAHAYFGTRVTYARRGPADDARGAIGTRSADRRRDCRARGTTARRAELAAARRSNLASFGAAGRIVVLADPRRRPDTGPVRPARGR